MVEPAVVGVVGSGPAVEAVEAALSEVTATVEDVDASSVASVDLTVVAGPCGSPAFARAGRATSGTWIAVELGGVGGRPVRTVDAAVSVLDSGGGCFECLRTRVEANATEDAAAEPRTTRSDARLAGAIAGRLAVSVLDGQNATGRVVELPHAERRLLPVPGCSCDAPPASRRAPPDRTYEAVPIEATADRADGAVDGRVGIVREVGEVHSFPAPYYLATLGDTTGFSDVEAGPHAAGVAIDWNAAFVKAIGEALERYGAGVFRDSTFDRAPATDRADAVPPAEFVLAAEHDEPDPAEPIAWYPGESLHTGRSVSLPAEFVVFPFRGRRHAPAITTGLGLGTSGVGALLSGLYEVVERDATMLSWYSTFEPLGLTVDDAGFETLARRARSEDLSVTPLLVTQDVDVPVVSVAVHREDGWPRFAVGSGANLDPAAAARSALAEALQNWMELRSMGPERSAEDPSAIAHHAGFPDEARSFVDVDVTVDARDVGPRDAPEGADELEAVLDLVDAVGLESYAARLTPRDVDALGFEVVRVLVPGAQPLFTGEPFFGDRARAVPSELGFEPRLDRPTHPYP